VFAGAGAAVVVVAVIVFLVLNSGNGGSGGNQTAQSPGNQPTTGHSSTSKSASPSNSAVPADLGKTPSESKITDYGAAGRLLTESFYPNPAGGWNLLTPAAQAVYGSQEAYQAYWAEQATNIKGYRKAQADGPAGSDGSLNLSMELNGVRRLYHIVLVGGQLLSDRTPKFDANPHTGL
jgi:hypothetical protein